jgi:CheY-like chemotaxis protein
MQNILIVDDTTVNLTLLYKILNKIEDLNVVAFKNGIDAVDSLKETDYALAILDVDMPVMNGFVLANKIREKSDIPIIFLTGVFNDEANEFKGYDSGAVDFLTKPIHQDILLSKVKIFINIAKNQQEQEKLIKELKDALDHIKKLHGIIPICSTCKKILTQEGEWMNIEDYVRENTQVEFAQNICPDCVNEESCELENNNNESD